MTTQRFEVINNLLTKTPFAGEICVGSEVALSSKKRRQVPRGTGKRFVSDKSKSQDASIRRTPPAASYAEQSLRKRISHFGLSDRFREDFERAFEQYMGPGSIQEQGGKKILVLDDEDAFVGFQEWYYFDYVLSTKEHIIDLFSREEGPHLPEIQRQMMEDWLATNRLHLFETQSLEPGIGETVQDLLSGEVLHLNDISFSYNALRWSIALLRPLLTEGRWHFTGTGIILSPLDKRAIVEAAQDLWKTYQENHPGAELLDFYRDHSLDLLHAAKEIDDERRKPSTLLSGEGHPVVTSRAEFIIPGDVRKIERALDQTEEFIFESETQKGEYSGCLHYIWLLRGRSYVPEAPKDQAPPKGLKLHGGWTAGVGEPEVSTLGDLYLCPRELTLLCISRERLEAGKKFLSEILGNKIQHRQDSFKDVRESNAETSEENEDDTSFEFEDEGVDSEELRIAEDELKERATRRWIDTPDNDGVTPRQSAQMPEGREKLRETMKILEFMEDQDLKAGRRPAMCLDIIRKELGL